MLHHPFSYIQRRRSRRRRVTDSVLAGIRRHYAKVVDILSYVGLGLVLYAGALPALSSCRNDAGGYAIGHVIGHWYTMPGAELLRSFSACSMPSKHSAEHAPAMHNMHAP